MMLKLKSKKLYKESQENIENKKKLILAWVKEYFKARGGKVLCYCDKTNRQSRRKKESTEMDRIRKSDIGKS